MKVLSIQQPWAWAILAGVKRVENRTWRTHHRGPLLIHAAKSRARLGDFGPGEPSPDTLVFGAIVGGVLVTDCRDQPDPLDRFSSGPFCWLLLDPVAFAPIPCSGRQAIWIAPPELLTEEIHAWHEMVR